MPAADDLADLALVTEAARSAARIALGFFGAAPRNWLKNESSPVCEADIAVDQHLLQFLTAARPRYGWLSEETADSPERLGRRRLFVVDPIDGTRAFLAGLREWMVSIAVVEDGRTVAAALAAPALGPLYAAVRGGGATRDGAPIAVTATRALDAAVVAGAKVPIGVPLPEFGGTVPRVPSLALRFVRVAEGMIDAAFASRAGHDWDVAGADLLITEAGGLFTDTAGHQPRYNVETTRQPSLFAAGPALHAALLEHMRRHGGEEAHR